MRKTNDPQTILARLVILTLGCALSTGTIWLLETYWGAVVLLTLTFAVLALT